MAISKITGFSKRGLWSLFLMSAFPIHVWTIILFFMDFSWISKRTDTWDAIGVGAYALVFAFIESVFVFLFVLLLSLLIPRKWDEARRISLSFVLIFVISFWAIVSQIYYMAKISIPEWWIRYLTETTHPLWNLLAITSILIIPTIVIPFYFVAKSQKMVRYLHIIMEKLELLTAIYLFFDFVGLVLILFRNL